MSVATGCGPRFPGHDRCAAAIVAIVYGVCANVCFAQPAGGEGTEKPFVSKILIDVSEAPQVSAWAEQARQIVEEWQPKVAAILHSDVQPAEIHLVFKRNLRAVAATSGNTINIAVPWIEQHPEDLGMVVHELVHVIQGYRRSEAPWLVEGIADYVRYVHYEPNTKIPLVDPERQSYRDGYKTSAIFLAWVAKTHNKQLIPELNRVLQHNQYDYGTFPKLTGHTVDHLWADYVDAMELLKKK